jgi:hypothetical protein
MGLTDKALEIILGALLVVTLWFFAEQELVLRHGNSTLTAELAVERQCRVGSACATKLQNEADRGAAMAQQARADAAAEAAAQKSVLDKQAADALRSAQEAATKAQTDLVTWKQKYQQALQAPDCGAWAKQAVVCSVR